MGTGAFYGSGRLSPISDGAVLDGHPKGQFAAPRFIRGFYPTKSKKVAIYTGF